MKIAMIGHKKVPSRLGGVEIHVEEIGARLAARGHEVDVYNRAAHGIDQATHRGMNLKYVKSFGRKGVSALVYSIKAALKVSSMKYDIIHFHALGPAVAGILPLVAGKNLVSTVHGLDWKRSKWNKAGVLFLKVGEWVVGRLFHRTIIVSEPLTEYFSNKYQNNERFIYIPNGIGMEEEKTTHERNADAMYLQQTYGTRSQDYYLFVSRLVPEKACHALIEAFQQVKTGKQLVIVGDNPEDPGYVSRLKKLAECDPRILMVGFKGMDELNKLYAHAFCYILPSEVEGLPISLLEAMSQGCFCLTSDIQENAAVLKGFGRTFRNRDVNDLQNSIEEIEQETTFIMEDYGLGSMGLRQVAYIGKTYNWDEVTDQTERVYASLLEAKTSQKTDGESIKS